MANGLFQFTYDLAASQNYAVTINRTKNWRKSSSEARLVPTNLLSL